MYSNFFHLHCLPFEDRVDTKFFFGPPACEELLQALEHECRHGTGMTILLGESGSGKTMLIRALTLRLPVSVNAVVLTPRAGGKTPILRQTCKGFGGDLPSVGSAPRYLARLRRQLKKAKRANCRSILIVDRAENLSGANLNDIGLLAELKDRQGKYLTIMLVGQPELRPLFDSPQFARLRQHLSSEVTLPALTQAETGQYIQHRLRVAGGAEADLFDQDTIPVLHSAARGIPALVNHFCDQAMRAACGNGEKRVTYAAAADVTKAAATQERTASARDVSLGISGPSPGAFPGVAAAHVPPCPERTSPQPEAPVYPDDGYGSSESGAHCADVELPGEESGNGGMADTLVQGTVTRRATAVYTNGETLIDRLESTIAKAERVSITSEATLAQQTAVEKHLGSLMPRAERLAEGVDQTVQRAAASLERTQGRLAEVMSEAERRISSIEADSAQVAELSQQADQRIRRVEHACELAESVESRLASFAEQLADRVDAVQEQMTRLMTGIESGEEVTHNLDSVVERASAVTADSTAAVDAQRTRMKEESEALEREFTRRGKETQAALRSLQEQASCAKTEAETAVDKLDPRIKEKVDEARKAQERLTTEAKATVDELRTKLNEEISETQRRQEQASAKALAEHEQKLREQLDAHRHSFRQTCEAAQEQLRTTREQVESRVADASKVLEGLDDKLKAKIDAAVRMQGKVAVEALARFQKNLQTALSAEQRLVDEACLSAREQVGQVREDATSALADVKSAAESEFAPLHANLQDVIAESANSRKSLAAAVAAEQQKVDELLKNVQVLESRRGETKASTDTLSKEVEIVAGRANKLIENTERAKGEVDRLAARADEAGGKLVHAVERGEKLVSDVQAHQGQIETLHHNVATTLVDIGSAYERVNATRGQVVQCEQAAARLTATHKIGEETAERLDSIVTAATHEREAVKGLCIEADAKIDRLCTRTASATDVLRKLDESEGRTRGVAKQTDKSAREANQAALEAKDQAAKLAQLQQSGGDTASRLEELAESCDELNKAIETSAADAEEKIGRLAVRNAEGAATLDKLADSTTNAATDVLRKLDETEGRTRDAAKQAEKNAEEAKRVALEAKEQAAKLAQLQQSGGDTASRLEELVESCDELKKAIETSAVEAEEKIGQLAVSNAEGAATLDKLADSTTNAATDVLRKLDETEGRTRDAAKQADENAQEAKRVALEAKEQAAKLARLQHSGSNTASRLEELVESCDELKEAMETSAQDAEKKIGQLDAHNTEGAATLDKLADSTTNAMAATSAANGAADMADQRTVKAHGFLAQLSSTHKAGVSTLKQLDERIASGTSLLGTLGRLAAEVNQNTEQLDSNNTEATHLLNTLTEVNDTAEKVTERVQEAAAAAEKAADLADQAAVEAEEQTANLCVARDGCETARNRLDEGVASATPLHGGLQVLIGDVDGVIARLDSHNAAARQVVQELAEASKAGRVLIQEADGSTRTCERTTEAAKDAGASIRKTVDHAQATKDMFTTAEEDASRKLAELTGANDIAKTLIDRQVRLSQDVQTKLQDLTQQIETTSSSGEAGEKLMREFLARSQELHTELAALRQRAVAIEDSIKQATDTPNEIITTAQTQAAQLERVCGTVRKVFAGLAQNTLEAKQQVEEMHGTGAQVSERLARLTAETDRASNTLREWVNEAVHVQARLEESLKRCPSISETHPGGSLERISRIAGSSPRIANRSAVDVDDTAPDTTTAEGSQAVGARIHYRTQSPGGSLLASQEGSRRDSPSDPNVSWREASPGKGDAPKQHAVVQEITQLIQQAKSVAKR